MKKIIKIIAIFLFLLPLGVFAKDRNITLYLYYGKGCPHCEEEMKFLNKIEKKYSNLKIVKKEVWYNDNNSSELQKVNDTFSIDRIGVPTNVIGETVIRGYGNGTGNKIERAIKYYSNIDNEYIDAVDGIVNDKYKYEEKENSFETNEKESDKNVTVDIPIFGTVNLKNISLASTAIIIGLIDGFNPCAMWVLLFLISVLIGMKDKKRMWALGIVFLVTSALVYMCIMLAWISIAVKITTIIWIRNIIAVVALVGGIINLRSFFIHQDSGCEVVDEKKRKTIFKKIKKFTSEKSFILALIGVAGLAVSVNMVELACSAGLPLVFTELLAINNVNAFMKVMYTVLYIIFFLIDDLIVFIIAMFTMKITGISTKYNKYSHLLGGLVMLIIGILLILKPEWLMFNFK